MLSNEQVDKQNLRKNRVWPHRRVKMQVAEITQQIDDENTHKQSALCERAVGLRDDHALGLVAELIVRLAAIGLALRGTLAFPLRGDRRRAGLQTHMAGKKGSGYHD